jgi:UDP-N-acetylmuramate dehydrogenase
LISANLQNSRGEGGTSLQVRENVPLAPLTTFKVGGAARFFTEVGTDISLTQALKWANERDLQVFVLGGGSNLVVADSGWPGLVLKIGFKGIERQDDGPDATFVVGAGEDWDAFVAHTVADDCSGIENLSGIPGTVGGTPVQNVGAYGQEVSETIDSVTVFDTRTNSVERMSNAQCGFEYRTSIFNTRERGRYIVLGVRFRLRKNGTPNLKYADLQKHFGANAKPSLAEVREAVRQIRLSKAMLIVEGDEDCRSAGSFFKNPIVPAAKYDQVVEISRHRHIDREPPRYAAGDGMVKLSAAWLVEQSGFHKGYGNGRAGISRRHTLAIVNRGGATAADIIALKDEVQRGVKNIFGVELHPEPVFVGFENV